MTYMLRDRPDGQVEIILTRPVLVGIFPKRDVARRVCSFLQDEAIDWSSEEPAGVADIALVEPDDLPDADESRLRDLVEASRNTPAPPPTSPPRPVRNLPAVVPEKPRQPPILTPKTPDLTDGQIATAFRRIAGGEKLVVVAPDFGLTMGQLRGMWANHKRQLQKHIAEGGQVPCVLCTRPFTPSISHPDTCARCSHE